MDRVIQYNILLHLNTVDAVNYLIVVNYISNTIYENLYLKFLNNKYKYLEEYPIYFNFLISYPNLIYHVVEISKLIILEFTREYDFYKVYNTHEMRIQRLESDYIPPEFFRLTNITSLKLSFTKLNISTDIKNLINLHTLDLTNNGLKRISNSILNIKRLHTLYLSYNEINHISRDFSKLYNLKVLFLDHNKINQISQGITDLVNLQRLCLSHNLIETIPDDIINMKKCERIYLEYNKICKISSNIKKLENIEVINLNNNNILYKELINDYQYLYDQKLRIKYGFIPLQKL